MLVNTFFLTFGKCYNRDSLCRSGETGRRRGLKIPRSQGHPGSIPGSGTRHDQGFFSVTKMPPAVSGFPDGCLRKAAPIIGLLLSVNLKVTTFSPLIALL